MKYYNMNQLHKKKKKRFGILNLFKIKLYIKDIKYKNI